MTDPMNIPAVPVAPVVPTAPVSQPQPATSAVVAQPAIQTVVSLPPAVTSIITPLPGVTVPIQTTPPPAGLATPNEIRPITPATGPDLATTVLAVSTDTPSVEQAPAAVPADANPPAAPAPLQEMDLV